MHLMTREDYLAPSTVEEDWIASEDDYEPEQEFEAYDDETEAGG